ncbi:MAG TPA: hypothetical protein VHC46_05515 [Thermodesulfobacteriota bacterium]|nr:hypothetical protein [Thermodesulfobacteriota bacterium]
MTGSSGTDWRGALEKTAVFSCPGEDADNKSGLVCDYLPPVESRPIM